MPLDLKQFAGDARSLDAAAFAKRHGAAFLIRSLTDSGDAGASSSAEKQTNMAMPRLDLDDLDRDEGESFVVYPLRKRDGSGGELTIGSAPDSDVAIDDSSVDPLHAIIEAVGSGVFRLTDRGSTAGTVIRDQRAEPNKSYVLPFGQPVHFGAVRLVFMPAGQFIDFVKSMT